ncbi:hexosaminidase D-like isoform X1 [Danaus plexippus]|uniref:hexosaminidase D-like isoform X1 n=1 Tax=Danaus plexippus TaxID=13037 RepID=UPI002AB0078B|nr:hexosaminidase D-like isoform X1 [Danaus plexippus]
MQNRIVHFDLKGAPPKLCYLEKIFKIIKKWGATGVLLEWEDTFPYSGELVDIGSVLGCGGDGMYSMDEVRQILQLARNCGLEVIQLIQTIGHMEFVLKHPLFQDLRELPYSPAVLCPSQHRSQLLVREMLRQVLEVQPDARYIHIGADEVWHRGECELCKYKASTNEHKLHSIYLEHIRDLALFIKQLRPDLIVLMWDDMLRSISVDVLKNYSLGELVQPVVWNYSPLHLFHVEVQLWTCYSQVFPNVWAASAYKGASGSCEIWPVVSRYASNQQAWLKTVKEYSSAVNFVGVVLTGWSRFDHYATLCELLPPSLPSLSICLKMWMTMDECFVSDNSESLPLEEWPGVELALSIRNFASLRERAHNVMYRELVPTWLNPWQLQHAYTSPIQLRGIVATMTQIIADIKAIHSELLTQFPLYTGERSAQEWLGSLVTPLLRKVTEVHDVAAIRTDMQAGVTPGMTATR